MKRFLASAFSATFAALHRGATVSTSNGAACTDFAATERTRYTERIRWELGTIQSIGVGGWVLRFETHANWSEPRLSLYAMPPRVRRPIARSRALWRHRGIVIDSARASGIKGFSAAVNAIIKHADF